MAFILGTLPSESKKWSAFDLDWTLIRPTTTPTRCTLTGGPFCLQANDWTPIPGRIERLNDFIRDGYSLIIISNQKAKGKKLDTVKQRMQNVYNYFVKYFPDIVILYSTDDNIYRKPNIGWSQHLGFLPGSLYCGDACQDPTSDRSWGYSDTDRQFAINMGLPFYSVEEVFPQILLPKELFEVPKVVLILVGPPGSGKSSFAKSHPEFVHIESDKYKSNWLSIEKVFRQALSNNSKIFIDATNPTRKRRLQIIQIAAQYNAPCGIILFLNSGKWNVRPAQYCRTPISQMAFNMFWSRFEEPTPSLEYNVPVYYQT
jgi:bifunctional polynucleotide phosphatase/kinase